MLVFNLSRNIKMLSVGFFFSKWGEFAFEMSFAVSVVSLTEANLLLIGAVYFFRYLPSALFSPIGGWLADNFIKRRTLIAIELAKGGVALVFFIYFYFTTPALAVVISVAMMMTALDCLYVPTFRAYVTEIVEKDQYSSVNSGIQVIEDASSILGPLVFSVFAFSTGAAVTFLFFAICLGFSAASIATLLPGKAIQPVAFNGRALIIQAARSVNELRVNNAPLFAVICCTALCAMFATSVVRFILPVSVLEHFGSEAAVGYVYSVLAAGTVLGGMLYTRFNRKTTTRLVRRYWIMYGSLFSIAAVVLVFDSWVFVVILFLIGFVGAFVDISIVTNIQNLSENNQVGRNFSLYYFTALMGDAVSGLIASFVFLLAGPATFVWLTLMLVVAPLPWNMKGTSDVPNNSR